MSRTVRDAALEVLRDKGMTTIFANPGTTEMALLGGLPEDFAFVLGLHESAVIGMAAGHATATGAPAFALLHTAAGLGNAVNLLATARENRAPVVIIVGQQDRRHLAFQPFLTGRLDGMAGDYPVWSYEPPTAADVPGALARAYYEARLRRGPAVVVVPMSDWDVPLDPGDPMAAPRELRVQEPGPDPDVIGRLAQVVTEARRPALVVGAGADDSETWDALVRIADALSCDVYQEAFSARAGFPQHHARFRGHLPAERGPLRTVLERYDVAVFVGVSGIRQFRYDPGPFLPPGTRSFLVTDDAAVAASAPIDVAHLGSVPAMTSGLAEVIATGARDVRRSAAIVQEAEAASDGSDIRTSDPSASLTPVEVYARLGRALPKDCVLIEETPSTRKELLGLVPAREPLGHLAAAMGGLGFAMPAAIGVRMATPRRPVVAVLGDGSSLYSIQALWSAVHYRIGVLFLVMANGRYAVLDRQIDQLGHEPPWPPFDEVSVATVAEGFGCEARRCTNLGELDDAFEVVLPTLADRSDPLVIEVGVSS